MMDSGIVSPLWVDWHRFDVCFLDVTRWRKIGDRVSTKKHEMHRIVETKKRCSTEWQPTSMQIGIIVCKWVSWQCFSNCAQHCVVPGPSFVWHWLSSNTDRKRDIPLVRGSFEVCPSMPLSTKQFLQSPILPMALSDLFSMLPYHGQFVELW